MESRTDSDETEARGTAPTCLVVDDDEMAGKAIRRILQSDGFEVEVVTDGESAVERVKEHEPDVVVLDLDLPGINGHQAAKQIRELSDTYILMLTGNHGEVDKVLALSTATDDYMTKPFSTAELVARLRALMRRSRKGTVKESEPVREANAPIIDIGNLQIDNHARRLTNRENDISVTRIEFDIFYQLANDLGACIPRATMIRNVWGFEGAASQHSLDVHVHNLRRKLDEAKVDDVAIEAVRSVGFRLVPKTP
jgi:two-component system OmpR family response regulator